MRKRFNRRDLNRFLGHEAVAGDVVNNHVFGKAARSNPTPPSRRTPLPGQQVVKGYRHSMVGSIAQYRSKVSVPPRELGVKPTPAPDEGVIGNRPKSGAQDEAKTGVDRRAFTEPPKRSFDPFG